MAVVLSTIVSLIRLFNDKVAEKYQFIREEMPGQASLYCHWCLQGMLARAEEPIKHVSLIVATVEGRGVFVHDFYCLLSAYLLENLAL
jgi:hypothetical protein